jgi:hypothetical protein
MATMALEYGHAFSNVGIDGAAVQALMIRFTDGIWREDAHNEKAQNGQGWAFCFSAGITGPIKPGK